jgi:putative intracellular protease/amidase
MLTSNIFPFMWALSPVLAIPQQPPFTNTSSLPQHYGLVIFPGFQALDVFGPLDLFNTLNALYNLTNHLSIISTTLEPVSTTPKRTPTMNMSHGDFGEAIVPTNTFERILKQGGAADAKKGDIDVLIIPGGGGTREPMTEEIAFVKAIYPKVNSLMATIGQYQL